MGEMRLALGLVGHVRNGSARWLVGLGWNAE